MTKKFIFDDNTKSILKEEQKSQQGRPKKESNEKRNKSVNSYLTKEEYKKFIDFLEGVPVSVYMRQHILEKIS
jgi:hypothetical protein